MYHFLYIHTNNKGELQNHDGYATMRRLNLVNEVPIQERKKGFKHLASKHYTFELEPKQSPILL